MAVRPPTDISANNGKKKSTTKGEVCLDRGL